MIWVLLFLIGLFAGTLGAIVGLGGGIIIVPTLLFIGGSTVFATEISPQIAVGTSLFTLIFTGLSSTLAYLKRKVVDYKSALLFFIGIGPGSIIGSWSNQFIKAEAFTFYFGILMIFMSFLLMIKNKLKPVQSEQKKGIRRTFIDSSGKEYEYGYRIPAALCLSLLVGFISGIFGIGGGSLMVPVMMLFFKFPPHIAVGTSMMVIFLSAISGSVTHLVLGNVNWLFAIALIPGGWIGAKVGAFINSKLQSNGLVLALRITLIVLGIRLIWQGIGPML